MSYQSSHCLSSHAAGLTPEHNAGIDFTCKESYLDDDEFAKVTLAALAKASACWSHCIEIFSTAAGVPKVES